MNKRQGLNIGLVVLVLLLALLAWYESGRDKAPPHPPLTSLMPGAVNKIEIVRRDHGTIILTGQGDNWWLKEPVRIAANRFRVESILGVLTTDSLAQFPAAGKDLAAFGLKQPAVRARFNNTELVFGALTPVDQRRYVLVGDTVHLIVDSYFFDFVAEASDFASRNLVPTRQRIAGLTTPAFQLEQDAEGKWAVRPADYALSADAIQAVIEEWQHAQAVKVALYQSAPALGRVTLTLAGQRGALHYEIAAEEPEWILARPEVGLEFHLSAEQGRRLFARANGEGKDEQRGASE